MKTETRAVPGYEGLYEVDTLGNIYSLNYRNLGKRQALKKTTDNNGYVLNSFVKDGIHTKIRIHRVVAFAFIPNPNNLPFINHINGIKTDNRVENLEWCDCKSNNLHAREMGLNNIKGSQHGRSKLTESDVLEIRKIKAEQNISDVKIALMFSCSRAMISNIISRKNWTHI